MVNLNKLSDFVDETLILDFIVVPKVVSKEYLHFPSLLAVLYNSSKDFWVLMLDDLSSLSETLGLINGCDLLRDMALAIFENDLKS